MTSTDTAAMLRAYYASWGSQDPELVLAFFTETSVFEDLAFNARFEGLPAIRSFVDLTYGGAPDFKVEPVRIVVQDPTTAAAAWVMSGTHRGDMPGLPATGKSFQVRASSIITLADGKILEMVDYWNLMSFQKAVGLLEP